MEQIRKGMMFKCVKTVYLNGNPKNPVYIKGKIYRSDMDNYITDELGNVFHRWFVDKDLWERFRRVYNNKRRGKLKIERP